ncbi:hypothetical protein PBCVCVM1_398R [Paramecium bursaria Chlorella virus CVM-1]|nr:hypothetical protein PBCVCVM1_398R [Paramecium bursaria Chlorella virus CVM-1]
MHCMSATDDDALSQFAPQHSKNYGDAEKISEDIFDEVDITEIARSIGSVVNTVRPVNVPYSITYSSSSSSDDGDFFSTTHIEVGVPEYYHPNSDNKPDSSTTSPSRDTCPTSCSSEQAVVYVSPRGIRMQSLRLVQLVSGALSIIQLCIIGALYIRTTMPVSILLSTGNDVAKIMLFKVSIDTIVLVRLSISVIYNCIIAVPCIYKNYAIGIVGKHNYMRWLCYSISSPLFLILVAIVVGVADVFTLLYIFGLSCSTIFFAFLQERYEFPGTGGFLPTLFGWITGLIPWVGLGVYALVIRSNYHEGVVNKNTLSMLLYSVGFFGYLLYGTIHVLQYTLVSIFSDYMVGELAFILLDIIMNLTTTFISHFAFVP